MSRWKERSCSCSRTGDSARMVSSRLSKPNESTNAVPRCWRFALLHSTRIEPRCAIHRCAPHWPKRWPCGVVRHRCSGMDGGRVGPTSLATQTISARRVLICIRLTMPKRGRWVGRRQRHSNERDGVSLDCWARTAAVPVRSAPRCAGHILTHLLVDCHVSATDSFTTERSRTPFCQASQSPLHTARSLDPSRLHFSRSPRVR
jgi:hypothetical protein